MNKGAATRLAAVLLLGLGLGLGSRDAHAGIKCWTNKDGVRECGNVVPPEYAQRGHKEVSDQGITTRELARAKSAEEVEAERMAAVQAELDAKEAERLGRLEASRDRVLLDTFTTEGDLLITRDAKLGAIDNRINHAVQVIARLELSLEEMQGEAAALERGGKKVPDELRESIFRLERQIEDSREQIDLRHTEKAELAARFDADLLRYRELKRLD